MTEENSAFNDFLEYMHRYANRVCLIEGDCFYTYQDLLESVDQIKDQYTQWRFSSKPVIGFWGDFGFCSIALLLALGSKGAVVVPLGSWSSRETDRRAQEAGITHMASFSDGILSIQKLTQDSLYRDEIEKLGDHSGLVLFSSGTTGRPKVMLHDFNRFLARYRPKKNAKDYRILLFLLFDHIGGLDTLFRGLNNGSSLVVCSERDPYSVAKTIERSSVSVFPSTPTALNLLLVSEAFKQYDLSSLKVISYGAEPMTASLLNRLNKVFPGVQFQQKFGISETHVLDVRSRTSNDLAIKINDLDVEYKVVDGELYLKTHSSMLTYLNAGENRAFDAEGWFHTGDQVEVLSDGYMEVRGRVGDVINVGGEKVLPSQVESVLTQVPGVEECLVYGAPNGITGKTVHAKVKLSNEVNKQDIRKAIRRFCKERLEPHAQPVKIEIVNTIPHTHSLKKVRKEP
ncbi:MAG: fatty acid--CoA ligase family protein [Opitutales bacterium]